MREALRSLDPYTRYIDPTRHASERSEATGVFGGLGMELEQRDGAVRVIAPTPDGPAARAGIKAGDLIVKLDDEPLTGLPLSEAVTRMRGAPGTPVTLTLRRTQPEEEVTIALTREVIRRQVLRSSMEGDVLVLRLATFSGPVSAALEQAIAAAAPRKPKAIVLDMRGNGGGLLNEAVRVADAFLSSGDIVSMRGKSGNQRTWQADADQVLPGLPMVVLLDGRSASASELVAIALQENGRATVMGQRSFGKGTVQSTFSLGENKGAIKLTSGYYLSPKGRSLHKAGLVPDIELADPATASHDAKAQVDPLRCAMVRKSPDPALSCALTFLAVGSPEAFTAALAEAAP
jgi:carboxyl-terminal processing protease